MALSRRCLLALQGIAVVLLTFFVLVFILLVIVLRVSLGSCDSSCTEAPANLAVVRATDDSACNGAIPGPLSHPLSLLGASHSAVR